MIARCYLKLKDYNTAYELFQRCLSKKPLVSFYWSSFGILLAELNQVNILLQIINISHPFLQSVKASIRSVQPSA